MHFPYAPSLNWGGLGWGSKNAKLCSLAVYNGVRAIDVLRRYWQTAYGLFRSDTDLTSLSARQNMLACWLQPEKVTIQNVEYSKRKMKLKC